MILVVGAGAAGLAAAIFAASSGRPVTVIETTHDGGRKILISGGGRCNVLPAALEPRRFATDSSPRLVQRLLRSWPLRGQIDFFQRDVGIPLAFEDGTRKWFPASNRARDVRDGLIALARRRGVVFEFETALTSLNQVPGGWLAETSRGPVNAGRIILATGGLSVPATGSTGTGLDLARASGHLVHDTYPALTPLLAEPASHRDLSGVSLLVSIQARASEQTVRARGGFLFTHRGYSGPAVLDVSHVAVRSRDAAGPRAAIAVSWLARSESEWRDELRQERARVATILGRTLPQRLAERLLVESGVPREHHPAELRRDQRERLIERLVRYPLPWTGDEGYQKAEVTGGGVALDAVDPETLESRRQRGLFFCGEMLDAFGPIGGHNFAWAWATGRLAGRGAAHRGEAGS
jgi:predicted Rossmann fold flavoprotein